jgi:hypothetical protein
MMKLFEYDGLTMTMAVFDGSGGDGYTPDTDPTRKHWRLPSGSASLGHRYTWKHNSGQMIWRPLSRESELNKKHAAEMQTSHCQKDILIELLLQYC